MHKDLKNYLPIAEGISLLLFPHAEVAIHDLASDKIVALYNNLSKRKVGEESLLEELQGINGLQDVFPPYFKTNWDGRRMKCVSVALKNATGQPIGLLCINIDLSQWEQMHHFVTEFLQGSIEQPSVLFKDDWREKINAYVKEYLKKEAETLKTLTKEKKRELVQALHREGAFQAKHAAAYIADVLGLSRATIYNYLR